MHQDGSQMLTATDCANQAETVVFNFFTSKLEGDLDSTTQVSEAGVNHSI